MTHEQEWICTNPDCQGGIVLAIEATKSAPKCSCGADMKKPYNSPCLTILREEDAAFLTDLFPLTRASS